jgi:hypothetical protein
MRHLMRHPGKQLLFAALSLTDLSLTWWLLSHSDGQVYESNPVARWWLANHGWLGLAGFKVVGVLLVIGLAAVISRYRPRAAGRVLGFACAALTVVVLYSASLCRGISRAPEEPQPVAEERPPRGAGWGGFGRDPLSLLTHKSVQEELQLAQEQVDQVLYLADQQRGSFRHPQEWSREERRKMLQERAQANEVALAEALNPEQFRRVKQISWQQRGVHAFGDAEVAEALRLTDDQKEKIKAVQEEALGEGRGGFGRGGFGRGGHREEARERSAALRRGTEDKVMNLLTAEQKARWKELAGAPFQGEIRRPGFGGGDRPGRGWRRPGP